MAKIKSIIMLMIEPDMSEVESGHATPYKISIPDLRFDELKALIDDQIDAGCKIDLKMANDYLDLASLEVVKLSGGNIQALLQYCATAVSASPPKKGQANVLDVSKAWAEGPLLSDRANAAPPRVLFFEASASSIVNMGVWIDTAQKAMGDFQSKTGMKPTIKDGLEKFFGVPLIPCGMISHQSAATTDQIRKAVRGTLLGYE